MHTICQALKKDLFYPNSFQIYFLVLPTSSYEQQYQLIIYNGNSFIDVHSQDESEDM